MSPFRDSAREPPRCGCGHGRAHPMVSPAPEYSGFGWFFILIGVSWEPDERSPEMRHSYTTWDRMS